MYRLPWGGCFPASTERRPLRKHRSQQTHSSVLDPAAEAEDARHTPCHCSLHHCRHLVRSVSAADTGLRCTVSRDRMVQWMCRQLRRVSSAYQQIMQSILRRLSQTVLDRVWHQCYYHQRHHIFKTSGFSVHKNPQKFSKFSADRPVNCSHFATEHADPRAQWDLVVVVLTVRMADSQKHTIITVDTSTQYNE